MVCGGLCVCVCVCVFLCVCALRRELEAVRRERDTALREKDEVIRGKDAEISGLQSLAYGAEVMDVETGVTRVVVEEAGAGAAPPRKRLRQAQAESARVIAAVQQRLAARPRQISLLRGRTRGGTLPPSPRRTRACRSLNSQQHREPLSSRTAS